MGLVRRVWPLCVGLVAMVGFGVPAMALQATLVADAHVNSALPAVNSGTISNLYVGAGYSSLVQFDLSLLPAGTTAAQVSRAVLRVYCNRVDTAGLVSVQPVSGAWGEYSVTYGTLPALASAVQVFQVGQAGAYFAVDVTLLVQGWVSAPTTNNGLALTAGTAAVQFDSKENDLTGHAAELDITLTSQGPIGLTGAPGVAGPAGAAGAIGATGAMGPSGPAGSSVGGATGSYQGSYRLATSYGLGDVVEYQGSSYVSLGVGNSGNVPGSSAGYWGLLAQGGTGPTGPMGATGAAGVAGPAGPVGAAGPAGVAGPSGSQGSPGLVYQGAYASSTNYGLGDVVVWQGSSYSSLVAANAGNTPSLSPGQWGVLTSIGPVGATGAAGATGGMGPQGLPGLVGPNGPQGPQGSQGIAGQAGAQGLTGATGAMGQSGPMGPQGVPGPVGITYRGSYLSSTNYALADGVSYGGASYVSLVAGNQGNAPDVSPAEWSLFAAAGGAGATGPAGATGAQGAAGMQGVQGVVGATGPMGATGPQGPAVANYTGNYSSATNYGFHDAVSYGGSTYVSLVTGNVGNTPDVSGAEWAVLAAQGPAGPTGAIGARGPAGSAGVAGVAGAMGPQGPPVSFVGGWLIGSTYGVGDAVSYGGSSYIALVGNVGRQPDVSPVYWAVLAASGAVGPTGATGPTGLQGPSGFAGPQGVQGPAGPAGGAGAMGLTGAAGVAGPVGPMGSAGAMGPAGLVYRGAYSAGVNYGLNDAVTFQGASYISMAASNVGNAPDVSAGYWSVLAAQGAVGATGLTGATGSVGPQGAMGSAGAVGAAGPVGVAGMSYRGTWVAGTGYAVNDAVLFGGTTYIATASSSGLRPDLYSGAWGVLAAQGGAGATGPAGAAASVSVGTVTTGVAGSAATVTNSGTGSAAVLNFTIPQGAAGTNGGGGGAGTASFLSMYHAVSFNFNFYSVNNPNSSASEGAAVVTWVPAACTATTLTVFSQQSNAITVTLRQGALGSMTDTVLACVASSGGSCTVTGSVAVAGGSFLDLSVSGASGTAAGVWTAVGCS